LFGFIAKDGLSIGSDLLSNSLFSHSNHNYLIEAEFSLSTYYKLLPLFAILLGSLIGILIYHVGLEHTLAFNISSFGKSIYTFLNGKNLYDIVINQYVVLSSFIFGGTTSKVLDRGAFELVGPNGLSVGIKNVSETLNKLNTGNIVDYALGMIIFIAILSIFAFYPTIVGLTIGDIRLVYAIIVGTYFYSLNKTTY
jgi:NADH:ubiquinone oxidoreductase subunit 5 (subunit L)/multisubunit Na+/H+ antiporter MnhA subunit